MGKEKKTVKKLNKIICLPKQKTDYLSSVNPFVFSIPMHALPPRKTTKETNQPRKSKRQAIRQSVIQSVNEADKKKRKR